MTKDPDMPREGNGRNDDSGHDPDPGISFTVNIPFIGAISASLETWIRILRKAAPKLALAAAGAAMAVALMLLLGLVNLHKAQNQRPAPRAGSPQMLDFSFQQPGNEVPYCNTYYGSGRIPASDAVLVFDEAVTNLNQQLPEPLYSPDGTATPSGDGWRVTTDVGGGDPAGAHVELLALLVPGGLSTFTGSFVTENSAWWKTTALPPYLEKTNLYIVLNGQSGTC